MVLDRVDNDINASKITTGLNHGTHGSHNNQEPGLALGEMCVVTSLAMIGDVAVSIVTICFTVATVKLTGFNI